MSRIVLCTLLCGVLVGPVWAKGHYGAPKMPKGAYSAGAAARQQKAMTHAAVNQQRAMNHAAMNQARRQQHVAHNAAMRQVKTQQHVINNHMPHPGGMGPGPRMHHGRGLWRGPGPSDLHRWRRGSVPHAHYRSCWYDDVWYDAYGYPYYGTTVVSPAPVVTPAPVVVTPAPVVAPAPVVTPAPVVVTPAPAVVAPAPVVTPPPPPPAVVY